MNVKYLHIHTSEGSSVRCRDRFIMLNSESDTRVWKIGSHPSLLRMFLSVSLGEHELTEAKSVKTPGGEGRTHGSAVARARLSGAFASFFFYGAKINERSTRNSNRNEAQACLS